MPLFDYKCEECYHRFEVITSSNKTVLCPKCDGQALTKLLSAPAGFIFKGNGAYATDYKGK